MAIASGNPEYSLNQIHNLNEFCDCFTCDLNMLMNFQSLRTEIFRRLERVPEIKFEPKLLSPLVEHVAKTSKNGLFMFGFVSTFRVLTLFIRICFK